ncbi:hypothetical protein GW17_00003286 [Ensete ventricosum]|nr:hypothetical protein GW17_00003286 [Ensete ventricosum]
MLLHQGWHHLPQDEASEGCNGEADVGEQDCYQGGCKIVELCVVKDGDATKMPQLRTSAIGTRQKEKMLMVSHNEEDFIGEYADLLGKDFSLMKRRCSHLCRSDNDEEEGASIATIAFGLSTGDVVPAFVAIEEVS